MNEGADSNASQTSPRDQHALAALEAISQTYHALVLYGEDHPSQMIAAGEAAAAIEQTLGAEAHVRFDVAGSRFLLDDRELPETETLRMLVSLFGELEVASIELRPGLTAPDVVALADALLRCKRGRQTAAELEEDLRESIQNKVRVTPLDYSRLRSADGAGTEAVSWADLARLLTNPDGTAAISDPQALADLTNTEVNAEDQPGVEALRQRLQFAASAVDDASQEGPSAMDALRAFVETLSPDLRDAMLRLDIDRPDEWIAAASEVAPLWPMNEILEALKSVDRRACTTSDEALLLFSRLATITIDDPEHSADLAEVTREWGSDATSSEAATELLESLSEVLATRQQMDFTPEDYRQQLTRIAAQIGHEDEVVDVSDATDPARITAHTYRVAIALLGGGEIVQDYITRIGEYLERALPDVLEQGRLDLAWGAVQAAVTLEQGDPERPRAVARQFLDELTAQAPNLVSPLRTMPEVSEDAVALLRHLGPAALPPVLAALAEHRDPAVREALLQIARSADDERLVTSIRDLARDDCNAVRHLAPLIERLPFDQAVDLVSPALQEAGTAARRVVYEMLARVGRVWSPQLLRSAITDHDERIQMLAIRHMREQDDAACIALMALLLAGRLVEREVSAKLFDMTLQVLTESKSDERFGWLSTVLRALAKSRRAITLGWPRRVAAYLRAHGEHPDVRSALRVWRFAPMRYVWTVFNFVFRRDAGAGATTAAP